AFVIVHLSVCWLSWFCRLLFLHSSPTRRSSDLASHSVCGLPIIAPCPRGSRCAARCRGPRAGGSSGSRRGASRRCFPDRRCRRRDRKSTRLNSSHVKNSYAGYCLKEKTEPRVRL